MKKIISIILLLSSFILSSYGKSLNVGEYGITPYSYRNIASNLQSVINRCKVENIDTLIFESGRYDIWPEGSIRRKMYISNTSSEDENPEQIKIIGMCLDSISDLTIEGNGAMLICHGNITPIAINNCSNVKLRSIKVDYERPGSSECTIENISDDYIDVKFHRDSKWEIDDKGKIHLYGEDWQSNIIACVEYNPQNGYYRRSPFWGAVKDSNAIALEENKVRFLSPYSNTSVGNVMALRDIIRYQVGFLVNESKDIEIDSICMYSMHGFGMICQRSANITMKAVRCTPREGSGRVLASSADFMHFSGCKGLIKIHDCQYKGAQDDCINIHGTDLRAIEKLGENKLKVRFMHPQSFGLHVYSEGDSIAFLKSSSMLRIGYAKVVSYKSLNPYEIELTIDKAIPKDFIIGEDCIENYTWTPSVDIRHNYFSGVPTRGILVTTPRKVVISDNDFVRTNMAAILIEGDARGWYESGPVKDVLIENNRFVGCNTAGPSIIIVPSANVIDVKKPVNQNIRIINNYFELDGRAMVMVRSTSGLVIKGNILVNPSNNPIQLEACSKTDIQK